MKKSFRLINGAMIVLSAVLGLVAAELVYSIFEPDEQRELQKKADHPSGVFDARLGWSVIRNGHWRKDTDEFTTSFHTNSLAMRYPEVPPKSGFRFAVLGDSYTWGHGVEVDDRYTNRLEKELGRDVLNFGRAGYSPVQYYLLLDDVIATRPDVVVVAFCLSNDFGESVTNYGHNRYRPYAALENGKLEIRGIPVPDVRTMGHARVPWLINFALGRFLYLHIPALWHSWNDVPRTLLSSPVQGMSGYIDPQIYDNYTSLPAQEAGEIVRHVLVAMQQKLAAEGIRMVVYPVFTRNELRNQNALFLLQDILEQSQIEMLPATPVKPDYFYPIDGHWNPAGHKKAADDLLPALRHLENAKP